MAILEEVKKSLGISSASRDEDIKRTIAAAKKDMWRRGVKVIDFADALTVQAVILYCRAWYNFQGDGERYMKAYADAADAMAMEIVYNER